MIRRRNKPEVAPLDKKYQPDLEKVARHSEVVHRNRQAIEKELQSKPEITRDIYTKETTQILFFADWHIGSEVVDLDAIKERLDYANQNDNVLVVFLGDVLEGIKAEYVGTNISQTHSDVTTQVAYFRELIKTLVQKEKVLAMVADYDGHSGSWVSEKTTYDLYQAIRSSDRLGLVQQGGRLNLRFFDPKTHKLLGVKKLDLYHSPPSGSGEANPTAGLSRAARRQKSLKPDASASGHTHKGAFTVELDPRGDQHIAIQEGTPKGSNSELPKDRMFLGKASGKRPHRSGGGLTVRFDQDGDIQLLPMYGQKRTELFNDAFTVLDAALAQSLVPELIKDIQNLTGEYRPLIKFDPRHSMKDDDPALLETRDRGQKDLDNEEGAEIRSPEKPEDQYSHLAYTIDTAFPLLILFGSHFFLGSNAAETRRYREMRNEFVKTAENNPHAVLFLMRGLMDKTVPARADRRQVVENQLAQLFAQLGEEGRILGLMLSGEDFRSERWKKSVGSDGPFMPGTYLAKRLNTHLYNNMSQLELAVGTKNGRSPRYKILAVDKVGQYGSRANTFNGLRSVDANYDQEVDVVAGGHMPGAGVMLVQDPYSATPERTLVAPGYFSKWVGQGKGNQQDASPGGQGVILMPNEKLVIPVADLDSALDQHLAFYLYLGLLKTGLLEKVLGDSSGR